MRKLFQSCRQGRVALSPRGAVAKRLQVATTGQGLGARGGNAPVGHPLEQGSSDGCPPGPLISAEESDVLYTQLRARVDGYCFSLPLPPGESGEEVAERVMRRAREAMEDVRLLNDIGWGAGTGEAVELTLPSADLRRALARYRDRAAAQLASEDREAAEVEADAEPHREAATLTIRLCNRVLADLDEEPPRA